MRAWPRTCTFPLRAACQQESCGHNLRVASAGAGRGPRGRCPDRRGEPFRSILGEGAGGLGVPSFFLLTGFVLSRPYVEQPGALLNTGEFGRFFRNRVLRIVPIYLVLVALLAIGPNRGLEWFLWNASFIKGWNHLWFFLGGVPVGQLSHESRIRSWVGSEPVGALLTSGSLLTGGFLVMSSNAMVTDSWRPRVPGLRSGFSLNGWAQPELWLAYVLVERPGSG